MIVTRTPHRFLGLVAVGWFLASQSLVSGQDVSPFPPTPSASQAGVTIADSTYQKRVDPKRLAADAPNILIVLMDDLGAGSIAPMRSPGHNFTTSSISPQRCWSCLISQRRRLSTVSTKNLTTGSVWLARWDSTWDS